MLRFGAKKPSPQPVDALLQRRSKREGRLRVIRQLTGSSVYAVSRAGQSRERRRRCFWSLIAVAQFCGGIYGIARIFAFYLSYPVNVNIRMEALGEFPAVTICNLNRMMKSMSRCLNESVNERYCQSGDFSTNEEVALVMSERRGLRSCVNGSFGSFDEDEEKFVNFLSAYNKMGPAKRKIAGQTPFDLFFHCAFNGRTCYSYRYSDYNLYRDLHYGNCYTFLRDEKDGLLELYLKADVDEYLEMTATVGVRVVVHTRDQPPNVEEDGINVSPGFETSIHVKETVYRRLKPPYKDLCGEYGAGENQNRCVRRCVQRLANATCGCVLVGFLDMNDTLPCDLDNATQACCLDKAVEGLAAKGQRCVCPLPCNHTRFHLQVSRARWPSRAFHNGGRSNFYWLDLSDIRALKQRAIGRLNMTSLHAFREEWVKVSVSLARGERRVIEQTVAFLDAELFSQLGGDLGLWLGLSLATLFEVVEAVSRLGVFACRELSRKMQKPQKYGQGVLLPSRNVRA